MSLEQDTFAGHNKTGTISLVGHVRENSYFRKLVLYRGGTFSSHNCIQSKSLKAKRLCSTSKGARKNCAPFACKVKGE